MTEWTEGEWLDQSVEEVLRRKQDDEADPFMCEDPRVLKIKNQIYYLKLRDIMLTDTYEESKFLIKKIMTLLTLFSFFHSSFPPTHHCNYS